MSAQVSGSSVNSFSILQDARPFLEEESETEERKRARFVLSSRIAERMVWSLSLIHI